MPSYLSCEMAKKSHNLESVCLLDVNGYEINVLLKKELRLCFIQFLYDKKAILRHQIL